MIDRQETRAREAALRDILRAKEIDPASGEDPVMIARDIIITTRQIYLEEHSPFCKEQVDPAEFITWIAARARREFFPVIPAENPPGEESTLFLDDRLALLALMISTSPQARVVKQAAIAAIGMQEREKWIARNNLMASAMQHALARCEHDNINALRDLKEALDKRGSEANASMGQISSAHDAGWTYWERRLVKACTKQVEAPSDEFDEKMARLLIDAIYTIFKTNHSSATKRLRKSNELTRVLGLLASEDLYPETTHKHTRWLHERLTLMFDIIQDSRQRPVLEKAALVALEQELEERWSRDFPDLEKQLRDSMEDADEKILPATALLSEFGEEVARAQYEGLRKAEFKNKRMRLVELVSLLDTYAGSPGLEVIVARSYEAIFDGLPAHQKRLLVDRLLRELEGLLGNPDTWKMLLDPLVLQNKRNIELLKRIALLAHQQEGIDEDRYEMFLFEVMLDTHGAGGLSISSIQELSERGGRASIPHLYPLTEQTEGFFNRPTPVAEAAQKAIDAIIEREGLENTGGSLTVAQGSGGELTLAMATEGALSVMDDGAVMNSGPSGAPMARKTSSRSVAIAAGGVLFFVLAVVLFVLFGGVL
jgi:hypothetical protein